MVPETAIGDKIEARLSLASHCALLTFLNVKNRVSRRTEEPSLSLPPVLHARDLDLCRSDDLAIFVDSSTRHQVLVLA